VPLETEAVEQRLLHHPPSPIIAESLAPKRRESTTGASIKRGFSTQCAKSGHPLMASERVNRLQTGIPVRSLLRKNAPDPALRGRASKRSSKPLCTRAVVSSDFQSRARDLGALRRFGTSFPKPTFRGATWAICAPGDPCGLATVFRQWSRPWRPNAAMNHNLSTDVVF
jgi:hypothetical protein